MKATWVALLLAIAAQAQQTIRFSDVSPAGSPMTFSGNGEISDSLSASYNVTGKNVSSKEILAYVVSVGGFETDYHDYFFKSSGIHPGDSEEITNQSGIPFFKKDPMILPVKVLFVQFANGSKWGDEHAGKHQTGAEMIAGRLLIRDFLAEAVKVYQEGGEQEFHLFLETQAKTETDVAILAQHLLQVHHDAGVAAALDHAGRRLQAAQARLATGKF